MISSKWLPRPHFRLLLLAALALSLTVGGGCDCNGDDDKPRDVGVDHTIDDIGDREDITDEDIRDREDIDEEQDTRDDADPNGEDPIAHLFIVHNSPDPALASVDLYLADEKIIDDLHFRSAQTFTEFDAGTFDLAITPDDSQDPFTTFTDLEFEADKSYVLIINGLLDPDEFRDNPDDHPLDLALYPFPDARDASTDPDLSQALFFHGAPDAGHLTVQVDQDDHIISDLHYGLFHDSYLDLQPGVTPFDLLLGDPAERHDSYQTTDLEPGKAYLIITSGFLRTSQNEDAPFELILFPTETDDGRIIQGTTLDKAARARFTHASIDPAVESLDLYLDDRLLFTGLDAYHSTENLTLRSGEEMELRFTAKGETDPLGTQMITLTPGDPYFAVISGVSAPDVYPENPDKVDITLKASTFRNPRQAARNGDEVLLLSYHGALDLPDIRVMALLSDNSEVQLVEKFRHTSFAAYQALPAQPDITVEVRNPDDHSSFLTRSISFEDLPGQAPLLIITGLNDPTTAIDDPDAPALMLLIVDQDGQATIIE